MAYSVPTLGNKKTLMGIKGRISWGQSLETDQSLDLSIF